MNRQRLKIMLNIVILMAVFVMMGVPVLGFYKPNEKQIQRMVKPERVNYVEDEIIVKFKSDVSQTEIEELSQDWGMLDINRAGHFSERIKTRRFKAKSKTVIQLAHKLQDLSAVVEYAELNYLAQALLAPDDPYYSYQWNLKSLKMEKVWDVSTGQGVVVGVVDTGVAYTDYGWNYKLAPDLAETKFAGGWDFVNNDAYALDDNGHGTHIAGTIAGSTNNSMGVSGIAYDSTIMPVKVLDAHGVGTYADIADGIVWAVDNGAQVINLSLGGSSYSNLLKDAVEYAYKHGVVVVAAAGNSAEGEVYYPAAYDDYVIAVGAVDARNNRAPYSNWGESLDFVAPGGDLNRDDDQNSYGDGILQQTLSKNWWGRVDSRSFGYLFYQGTSQAAAHFSGVVAVLLSGGINGPSNLRSILQQTAIDLGNAGWDQEFGWGLVNPLLALQTSQTNQTPPVELPEDNHQTVAIEEPEEEQVEVVESLNIQVQTTDKYGNPKSVFKKRERVYLSVVINSSDNQPVSGAEINLVVAYPNSSRTKKFNGQTNENGEWFIYARSYYNRGNYNLKVRVNKDGFETREWQGTFLVK